jgi:nucleotide-binding universal stress UspA family protein
MTTLKNILVATDFEDASDTALRYGRELARRFGATLHVLHVVEDVVMYGTVEGYTPNLAELQREAEEEAGLRLSSLLSAEDRDQLHAKTVLMTGAPASAVIDYARKARIDLILIGTHGRTGLGHFVMGSVAEKIVRLATCPVLTLKQPEHEFVLPDALQAVAHT